MKQHPLDINIDQETKEPYVSLSSLIELIQSSISDKGTQFDFALFNLASQLKALRLEAIRQIFEGDEHEHKE